MFGADQIVAHFVGDYIFQSHWMATNKIKSSWAALVHAVTYTLPFLFIMQNWMALAAIAVPHFFIDRFRLARYVVWLKNGPWKFSVDADAATGRWERKPLTATGYPDDVPPWLAVWLLIFADNTIHLVTNGVAIWWFA